MKAILNKQSWPKFLRVNGEMEKVKYNRYLLKPWVKGEIVKVLPFEEQKSGIGDSEQKFRKTYVRILRKDDSGKWNLRYTWEWNIFETLNNN